MSDNKTQKKELKGFNLSNFETDKKKSQEGVWAEYAEGLMLKIARGGNPEAKAYANKLALKSQRVKSVLDDEGSALTERAMKVAAVHILVDWKHLLEDDEKGVTVEVPYSSKKALQIFEKKSIILSRCGFLFIEH